VVRPHVLSGVREKNRLIHTGATAKAARAGGEKAIQEGVMNYYEAAKKVQEQRDMNFLKEIRKDKKFWADPMCYPVTIK